MVLWIFVSRNEEDDDTILNCGDSSVLLKVYLFNTLE